MSDEARQLVPSEAKLVRVHVVREDAQDPPQSLTREQVAQLDHLAGHLVHWCQAAAQLAPFFPGWDAGAVLRVYAESVHARHRPNDPRVKAVFDPDLRILYSRHGFLDADTLQLQKCVRKTIERLPAVQVLHVTDKGLEAVADACRVERVLSGIALPGYRPVRVVRGISLRANPDEVELVMPHAGAPVELLNGDILDQASAYRRLAEDLPGLSRDYLAGALAAVICAAAGRGQPPFIAIIGPSGSGKDQTLRLVASWLADEVQNVSLTSEEDAFWRRLASFSEAGHRFIHFPEIWRKPNLLKRLLPITNMITWRRLWGNQDVQTPNRAAYFFTGISLPIVYRRSVEMRRRTRIVRLPRTVPEPWEECLGRKYGREVDITEWRALSAENARIANSNLTYFYRICERHAFCFQPVADELGLLRIDNDDEELRTELCRAIYSHCRGDSDGRVMHSVKRWQTAWVDLRSAACWEIVQDLVPVGETAASEKKALKELLYMLESYDWNVILDIDSLPIQCETATHGSMCAIRFRDANKRKKGQGVFNQDLPPIGGVSE